MSNSRSATVDQDKTQLSWATIYSPIDGVVLDRKVSAGQTVAAIFSTPVLFTLASDLGQMELDVDIDEADVGRCARRRKGHLHGRRLSVAQISTRS